MPVLPAFGKQRQDEEEYKVILGLYNTFKASLSNVRPCLYKRNIVIIITVSVMFRFLLLHVYTHMCHGTHMEVKGQHCAESSCLHQGNHGYDETP